MHLSVFGTQELQIQLVLAQDCLVIQKKNSEKQKVICLGEELKVWYNRYEIATGQLKSLDGNKLTLTNKGTEKVIPVARVERIKTKPK